MPTHRRILKGLAYIPQQPGIFKDMWVEENLELGGNKYEGKAAEFEDLKYAFWVA